jgi:hypothetical protein
MNLLANPWTFTSTDQAATASITSIVRNGARSALVTLGGALTGLAANLYISIQGTTAAGGKWNGGYRIEDITPVANTFLIRIEDWRSSLANAGAVGSVFTMAYPQNIEVTQMLWDGATTGALSLTDQAGNLVWAPAVVAGVGSNQLTYMKAFPIFGLVINTLGSGTLQISV